MLYFLATSFSRLVLRADLFCSSFLRDPPIRSKRAWMKTLLTSIFVGRREEINQLDAVLNAVLGGKGQCVLVSGEAGIGKSRLLAEVQGRATQSGFKPLNGRSFEQDRSFPYVPLVDMFRPFLHKAWPLTI